MSPVQALRTDLIQSGIVPADEQELCMAYQLALRDASQCRWEQFYRALFAALKDLAGTSRVRRRSAVESLLLIVEDDLGLRLFGEPALAQIRRRALERSA
jgi:hypothetical protein